MLHNIPSDMPHNNNYKMFSPFHNYYSDLTRIPSRMRSKTMNFVQSYQMFHQDVRTAAIRYIALQKKPETPRTMRWLKGPLIGSPLCRETPVSRTANVSIYPLSSL